MKNQPEAVQELAKLAGLVKGIKGAESEQARIAALKELLDRGHGKATQAVDLNVAPGGLASLIDAELERIAAGGVITRTSQPTKPN